MSENRTITNHQCPGCDNVRIEVLDAADGSGACHRYRLSVLWRGNRTDVHCEHAVLGFQRGSVADVGVNGITDASLLAIVQDRIEGFQRGPNACDENAEALRHIDAAIELLKARSMRVRQERG